jgi:hypothetical protein
MAVSEPQRGFGARQSAYSFGPVSPQSARIGHVLKCRLPVARSVQLGKQSAPPENLAESECFSTTPSSIPSGPAGSPAGALSRLVEIWPQLSPAIRAAILATAEAANRVT